MDDLQFYAPCKIISVISGRRKGENERLCAISPRFGLEIFQLQAGLEPGTAKSVGQRLTYWTTGAPDPLNKMMVKLN